ncbi:hypothetical protein ABW20_dc0103438 [Dactylellina cionopaga]|nr:hypothetical protein ABW20_dc0103438 [Dactylellina cionopaga]
MPSTIHTLENIFDISCIVHRTELDTGIRRCLDGCKFNPNAIITPFLFNHINDKKYEQVRATDLAAAYYTHLVHTAKNIPTDPTTPPPPSRISINALSSSTTAKASIYETTRVLDLKLFVDYSLYLSHTPPPSTSTHLACLVQRSTYVRKQHPCSWREFFTPSGKMYDHYRHMGSSQAKKKPDPLAEARREAKGLAVEAKIYSGMYRLFTLSAILTNRYYEPFFVDEGHEDYEIAKRLREGYGIYWPREVTVDPAPRAVAAAAAGLPMNGTEVEDGEEEEVHSEAELNQLLGAYREYFQPTRELADDEVEYLMKWEVFSKRKFRERKPGGLAETFEELADYFCGTAKKRVQRATFLDRNMTVPRSDSPAETGEEGDEVEKEEEEEKESEDGKEYEFDIDTAAEIQEMMILNSCYEVWTRMRERMDSLLEPVRLTHEKLLYALHKDEIKLITIPVAFHAIYGVGDAMMPKAVDDFRSHPYGPVPPNLNGTDNEGMPLKHVEISDVLYQLVQRAGREPGGEDGPFGQTGVQYEDGSFGVVGGDSGKAYFEFGWAEYAFWEWVMKKKFGLRINWKWRYLDTRYDDFVKEGKAFMEAEQFRDEIPGILVGCCVRK